jgi:hypothetical protein
VADQAPGGWSLGSGQAGVASPTPKPGSQRQVSAVPWVCLQPIRSCRGTQCSWVLRQDPFLLGHDARPNRIIIKIIIFFLLILWIIIKIIIFITQIIIFRNPRILLTQIIISLIWILWIIRKIKIFITQIYINNNIFYIYTLNYNKNNNIFYVAPDIAAALKNITRKEQISDILFFWGKMSCLRSHHLVLWSLGTLTGQQRFYGSGLVT